MTLSLGFFGRVDNKSVIWLPFFGLGEEIILSIIKEEGQPAGQECSFQTAETYQTSDMP